MTSPIVQQLGFDATGAIAQLNTLNNSLFLVDQSLVKMATSTKQFSASGLGRSLANAARNADKLKLATTGIGTNLSHLVQGARAAQGAAMFNTITNGANNAKVAVGGVTASMQTLARVGQVQILLRAWAALGQQISEAGDRVVEFEKKVAEASTISGGQFTTPELQKELRADAKTFGLDVLDLANAKYQQFSNQVKDSTKNSKFFQTAQKLAVATNTSVTNSVDALATALNSNGKSANESEQFANTLFKTVEQGRITLGELSTSMGRVSPLAAQLGIDFSEVGAALATLTKGGNAPTVAVTQLRSVLQQLIKEGPEIRKAFSELGFEDITDALNKSGGFIPLIEQIDELKKGNLPEIAKLFKNIRATVGQTALTQEKGGLAKALEAISGEVNTLDDAFKTLNDTQAKELERARSGMQAAFDAMAETMIPLKTGFFQLVEAVVSFVDDGLGTVSTAVGTFVGVGTLIATTNAIITGSFITATASVTTFLGALSPILIAVTATATAVGILTAVYTENAKASQRAADRADELEKANKRMVDSIGEAVNAAEKLAFERQFDELRKSVVEMNKLTGATQDLDDIASNLADSVGRDLFRALGKNEAELRRMKGHASDLQKIVDSTEADLKSGAQEIADLQRAQSRRGKSTGQNALADANEAAQLIPQVNDLIAKGGTVNLQQAWELIELSIQRSREAAKAFGEEGRKGFRDDAEKQLIASLEGRQKVRELLGDAAAADGIKADAGVTKLLDQTEAMKATARQYLETLQDASKLQWHASALNGLRTMITDEIPALEKGMYKAGEAFGKGINVTQLDPANLTKITDLQATTARQADVRSVLGLSLQDVADMEGAVNKNNKALSAVGHNSGTALSAMEALRKQILATQFDLDNATATLPEFLGGGVAAFKPFYDALADLNPDDGGFDATSLIDLPTDEQIAKLGELTLALSRLETQAKASGNFGELLDRDDPATAKGLEQIETLKKEVQARVDFLVSNQENLSKFDETLGNAGALANFVQSAQQGAEPAQAIATATATLAGAAPAAATGLNNEATAAGNLARQAITAAEAVERLNRANANGGGGAPTKRAAGGFLYRASGGAVQGQDSIPAMLQRGEHVTNSKNAAQFASQLQAMNAGIAPSSRAQTTTNNNVNVGDINISSSSNPEATARQVVGQLKREFRRGTSSF